jgi:hypothetical protein
MGKIFLDINVDTEQLEVGIKFAWLLLRAVRGEGLESLLLDLKCDEKKLDVGLSFTIAPYHFQRESKQSDCCWPIWIRWWDCRFPANAAMEEEAKVGHSPNYSRFFLVLSCCSDHPRT